MAGGDILIRWASESSQAIRDMGKVERALSSTMSAQERRARRWQTASRVITGATVAWFTALGGVAVAYGNAMKSAQEDAAAQAVFENSARKAAGATQAQTDALNAYIKKAAEATLFTDDDLRPAMSNLLRATGDATRSQDLLTIAMDAATSTGKDVDSVTQAVGKAYNGNVSALKRLFPFIKDSTVASNDFAAAMKEIERRTKGASDAAAEQDGWTMLTQQLGELQESLGAVGNSKGGQKILGDLNQKLIDIGDYVDANPDALVNVGKGLVGISAGLLALSAASKGVVVLQGTSAALKAFPKAGALAIIAGEIIALKYALRDVDEESPDALKWLKELYTFEVPSGDSLHAMWVQPIKDAWGGFEDWFSDLSTALRSKFTFFQDMGLKIAEFTDWLGITEGKADELRDSLAEPFKAQIEASNKAALKAADEAEKALWAVVRRKYKAEIDAAESKAKAAAREAQRAIDGVRQTGPVTIDADGQRAMDKARAVAAAIEAMTVVMQINARVSGTGARAVAGAGLSREAPAPTPVTRIDTVQIVLPESAGQRDPRQWAQQIRTALVSDEARTGRVKVAR